jgi:hypothetical protein
MNLRGAFNFLDKRFLQAASSAQVSNISGMQVCMQCASSTVASWGFLTENELLHICSLSAALS